MGIEREENADPMSMISDTIYKLNYYTACRWQLEDTDYQCSHMVAYHLDELLGITKKPRDVWTVLKRLHNKRI